MAEYKLNHTTSKTFFLNTLTSKITALIGLLVLFLLMVTIWIWIANDKSTAVVNQFKELHLPITTLTYQINSEINATAIYTRAYLMSGEAKSRVERENIWKNRVFKMIDSLATFRKRVDESDFAAKTDSINKLAKQLKASQEKILTHYDQNKTLLAISISGKDSLSAPLLRQKIRNAQQMEAIINRQINFDIRDVRIKLDTFLKELNKFQLQSLNEEVRSINLNIKNTNFTLSVISIFALLLSILSIYFLASSIKKSINTPKRLLNKLAKGEINQEIALPHNEFAEIVEAINVLSAKLKNASEFALSVGEGNLDVDLQTDSEKDVLANSLLQMRSKLQEVSVEDQKRDWVTQGITKFSDLIRQFSHDIYLLGDNVLNELIPYLNAVQGGIFIANEPNEQGIIELKMVACFAYDRKKYLQKSIKVHPEYAEDLLGQIFLEKEKIYMTALPENYLFITSGLADIPPQHLLIVPIQMNDKVEGVIEIASLHRIEQYQIQFIERICEVLASAVITAKSTETTKRLLRDLQEQTEMLKAQEEEMRQNMEELQTTQEELYKQQAIMDAQMSAINHSTIAKVEFSLEGAILELNDTFCQIFGYNADELRGRHHRILVSEAYANSLAYKQFWDDLKSGKMQSGEHERISKSGETVWINANYVPVKNKNGEVVKIIKLAVDITDNKQLLQETQQQTEMLKAQEEEMRQNMEELASTQEQMKAQNAELEASNAKMQANQQILKKALEKNKQKEQEIAEINKQLTKRKEEFELMTRNVPGIIYQFMSNTETGEVKFLFLSDYVEKIFNYTVEEFKQLNNEQLAQLIHPEDKSSYYDEYFAAMKEIRTFSWEGRMKNKWDEWRWLKIISTPRKTEQPNIIISDGIFLDITERKLQEEELKRLNLELMKNKA